MAFIKTKSQSTQKNRFAILACISFLFLFFTVPAGILSAEEYEVTVGDRIYVLREGEIKVITTPKGEQLRLVVRKKKVLTYNDSILSFRYNSEMKVSAETELGIKTITAESTDSTLFMAQIFPYKLDPGEAIDTLIQSFKEEFKNFGATFMEDSITTASRKIGGIERSGKTMRFLIGDLRHRLEVYAFQKGDRTISVVFQSDHEDRDTAETHFKIIADSLK